MQAVTSAPARAGELQGARRLLAVAADRDKFPRNLAAEKSILGGVILRNEVLALLDDLETEDFFDHKHKAVWQAIRSLQRRAQPIDVVTLELELEQAERLDAIGGIAFLGELALVVPTADNVASYRDSVLTLAKNRRVIEKLARSLHSALEWPHDPDELLTETIGDLQRIDHVTDAARGLHWTAPIIEYLGDVEPDDDDREDWILRDLVPRGEPFLWGGPSKAGKTWAALDLCLALALGESWLGFENTLGRPARVMVVLLEDGRRRLHKRLWELGRGRGASFHDPAVLENLRVSCESIYLPDPRIERRLIDEAKAFGADLIAIDNLTRVMLGESKDERDVKAFAKSWKYISDETGAATGFLHHTRKSGSNDRGGDPFEALRGDGGILGFARHAIVVLPRREDNEMLSEVHMRGNLDLRRDGFVLGFERRVVGNRWQARFADRGDIEAVREKHVESKKEVRQEQSRVELESKIEKQLAKAIEIAQRKGHVTKLEVAIAFGRSTDTAVRAAFDLGVASRRLVKCAGIERNLGYRLPEQTQKGLL